jgi:hypothetical protein
VAQFNTSGPVSETAVQEIFGTGIILLRNAGQTSFTAWCESYIKNLNMKLYEEGIRLTAKGKAVPQYTYEGLGWGRGGITPTHSQPRH